MARTINHEPYGYLGINATRGGKTANFTVKVTAYAALGDDPMFFSLVGAQEALSSIRAFMSAGNSLTLSPRAGNTFSFKPEKKTFEQIAWTKLRTDEANVVIAHRALRGDAAAGKEVYMQVESAIEHAREEVFTRIERYLPCPLFPQWRPFLWTVVRASGWIAPLNCIGVNFWKASVDPDAWMKLISAGLIDGTLTPLTQIAG